MTLLIKSIMNAEKLQTVPQFFVLHVQIINPMMIVNRLEYQLVILTIAAMGLWDTEIIPIFGLNAPSGSLRSSMCIRENMINAWIFPAVINLFRYKIEAIDFNIHILPQRSRGLNIT